MEPVNSDSLLSSEGENKRHKLEFRKPIALNQYRRREKIRGRFGIMLLVYACMLVMLGYFLIEIMKMAK
jgi:hypothetical protein